MPVYFEIRPIPPEHPSLVPILDQQPFPMTGSSRTMRPVASSHTKSHGPARLRNWRRIDTRCGFPAARCTPSRHRGRWRATTCLSSQRCWRGCPTSAARCRRRHGCELLVRAAIFPVLHPEGGRETRVFATLLDEIGASSVQRLFLPMLRHHVSQGARRLSRRHMAFLRGTTDAVEKERAQRAR